MPHFSWTLGPDPARAPCCHLLIVSSPLDEMTIIWFNNQIIGMCLKVPDVPSPWEPIFVLKCGDFGGDL